MSLDSHPVCRAALAQAENTIDIGGALKDRAERYYNEDPKRQNAIQRLFVPRLVRVPKDGPPLRRRVRLSDLDEAKKRIADDLVASDMRLLVTSFDQDKAATAEVAHEILFKAWPRLDAWIGGRRGFLEWKEQIEQARKTWENGGHRRRDLLTGGALVRTKEKVDESDSDLDAADRDFIAMSKVSG